MNTLNAKTPSSVNEAQASPETEELFLGMITGAELVALREEHFDRRGDINKAGWMFLAALRSSSQALTTNHIGTDGNMLDGLIRHHTREAERRDGWARQAEACGLTRRHRVLLTQAHQHRKWAALLRTLAGKSTECLTTAQRTDIAAAQVP